MGSEAEMQAPPPEPAAPAAAASGGSKMPMILVAVVAVVIVVAALAYVFVIDGGGDELSGQWTVSGGTFYVKMVVDNDTANPIEMTDTFNASTEIIDFDEPTQEVGDMTFEDLGNGKFRLTGFDELVDGIGDIEGTYDIDGDTMTVNIDENASYVDDEMGYVELEIDITWTLERA